MSHTRVSFRCINLIVGLLILVNATACETAVQTSISPNKNGKNVVITFAGWESDRQFYELLMDAFHEQYPEITVQFAALPDHATKDMTDVDTYYRKLASRGDTLILGRNIPTNVAHYFRDLQPLIESNADSAPDDFWPGALDACQDKTGHLLGIPVDIGFQGIFYDQEAFDAANLPHPYPGWTWEDFRTAVRTLAQQDGKTIRYGYAESSVSLLSPLIATAIEDSGGEIDAAILQPHIQWYLDLIRDRAIYLLPDEQASQSQNSQAWESMFKSENRPAMWAGGLADVLPGYERAEQNAGLFANAAFKTYGFVPYPVPVGSTEAHTSPAWVECAAISAGSQHPREAWIWLNFLSQHRLIRNPNEAWEIVNIPGRISVTESSNYWKNLPAEMEPPVRYILQHAWYGTAYPEALAAVNKALSLAATDDVDFESALNESKAQLVAVPQPTPNRTPITIATPHPTTPANVVEIRYAYRTYGEERQAIEAAAAAYNQTNPDVMVRITTDFDISETDPLLSLTANFDCFTTSPLIWETQHLGSLLTLDAFLDAEGEPFIQDFAPASLDVFRYDGELYGIPAYSIVSVIAYNADLLTNRGVQPPANDWTFNDFLKMINASASPEEADRIYGFLFNPYDFLLFDGRGAIWADFKADPPIPAFDSPEFSRALDWINNLLESGVLLLDQDFSTSRQAILSGQVAFWSTSLEVGDWFAGQKPNFKIGIAPIPIVENSPRMFTWGIEGHYISRKAKEPRLCWNWIKFLSEQPNVFNGIPARISVANSPEWATVVGAENAEVYRLAVANAIQETMQAQRKFKYSSVANPLFLWRQQAVTAMLAGEDYHALLPELQKKASDYQYCMQLVDTRGLTENQLNTEIQRCVSQADPSLEPIMDFTK